MLRKNLAILSALLTALLMFGGAARAQEAEAEAALDSKLFAVRLPSPAARLSGDSVPAEINGVLDRIVAASAGKFGKGETEVLVWTGATYAKADAATTVSRLTGALKNAGWQYALKGEENGVSYFMATRDGGVGGSRTIVGFYTATDTGLIVTAMELVPTGDGAPVSQNRTNDDSADVPPATATNEPANNARGGSIVGKWSDGYVSLLNGYSPTTGPKSYTPGRSHRFEYVFNSDGTFTYTGLMQNTIYNCTTTIFNDQRGTYKISGDKITMTKTKNFFRRNDSCSAANFMERDYTLGTDTYAFSVSRNDRGKSQVCFNDGKTNVCYERDEK